MANGRRLTAVNHADAAARGSVISANGAHLLNDIRWGEAWSGTGWSGRRPGTRAGRQRNERNSRGSGEIQSHGATFRLWLPPFGPMPQARATKSSQQP
jgi:hypothetical protein